MSRNHLSSNNFSIFISHVDVRRLGGWAMRSKIFLRAMHDISETYVINYTEHKLFRMISQDATGQVILEEKHCFKNFEDCQQWVINSSSKSSCVCILFRHLLVYRKFSLPQYSNVFVDIDDLSSEKIFGYDRKILSIGDLYGKIKSIKCQISECRDIAKAKHIFRIRDDRFPDSNHSSSCLYPATSANYLDTYKPSHDASKTVLFIGTVDHIPNRLGIEFFLRNCLDDCIREVPGFRFVVISHATMDSSKEFLEESGKSNFVEIKENVDDIKPYYEESAIFLNPTLEGTGASIKTIEGFLMGRTGVISPFGLRGLANFQNKNCVLIQDSRKSFSNAVVRLLLDCETRHQLELNAFNFAFANYNPTVLSRNISQFILSKKTEK